MSRPIRFGLIASGATPFDLVETAVSAEGCGFSTIALNDHFNSTAAPLLGLQATAAATSSIRLATAVLNHDMRHPAVLAKEIATLDVLSGGRVELGVGAGWVREDYTQSGIALDSAGERIARLEEYVELLRCLFGKGQTSFAGVHYTVSDLDGTPKPVQAGGPPIMIGGGGRKLLSTAGRCADIVQVIGAAFGGRGAVVDDMSSFRVDAYEERLDWLAQAAGDRFDDIELSLMMVFVKITDDVERAAREFLGFLDATVSRYGGEVAEIDVKLQTLIDSPVVAIGTLDEVCAKIVRLRETLGFTYFVMPYGSAPQDSAPIIDRLSDA